MRRIHIVGGSGSGQSTQVVILDLPYPVLLWRCLRRTLARGLGGDICCDVNRESVWRLVHRDGVVRQWRAQRFAPAPTPPA